MAQSTPSSLESIYNYSFPSANLLQISLVRQTANMQDYKKQYFCFISLAPGEQAENAGGRSYNFKNKINFSFFLRNIFVKS